MKKSFFLLATALGVTLTPPCLAQDPPPLIGKLFMTPEKRQILEHQRQLNLRDAESMEAETLQLDGVVQRSSGYNSVWINQHMQDGRSGGIHLQPRRPGTATIETNPSSSVQLQVGDTINRSTQERKPLVAPNAVRADEKP